MSEIPTESRTLTYIQSKGWNHSDSGVDQVKLEQCPFCYKTDKFYINVGGGKKDGLWQCFVCNAAGNLYKLMESQGDKLEGVMSMKDSALGLQSPDPIPSIGALHKALLEDEEALDYLIGERGFQSKVIERYQLGVEVGNGIKWLVIPYISNGVVTFVKYRSLPPAEKQFRALAGREAPLYNADTIKREMEELIFVEGESDCLSVLSNGIESVVGIPGANVKKATWIQRVLDANPKKIYLLYDNDKVGQKAAKEMAKRIGNEKCFNICLPPFQTRDDKEGKDINEWFQSVGNLEDFETLKKQARPFDVDGVTNLSDALDEIEAELDNRGTLDPTLKTPWKTLDSKLGGCEWGDLIGIIAEGKVGKTTMCLNWLDYYVQLGFPCMMYCLEMSPKRLARKWCSYVTETDDTPGRSLLSKESIRAAKAIALERDADLLFGYTRASNKEDVFDTIRQAVRLYGVKVVCFDNLQLLCRNIEHSAQETSVLTKSFKELAMELGIVILLVVQPNRVREGEIVAARNAHGSSAIEKDVDSMIALHRKRIGAIKDADFFGYMDTESTFEPQLLVNVDLNRYGPGGRTTLLMEGHISKIREFDSAELDALPKPSFGGVVPVEENKQEV
jgi:5S rRNA maturation endonuclease (ribonuclease M5)/KaiC/GvpD/RAD55 family RecA-like ATPase